MMMTMMIPRTDYTPVGTKHCFAWFSFVVADAVVIQSLLLKLSRWRCGDVVLARTKSD
jgi:hypothetical protein